MNLSALRPEIFMHAPAEYPVIDHYILRGVIDFFNRSEAWQVTNTVSISAGASSFNVPSVSNAEFLTLISIELGDTLLEYEDLRKFCKVAEGGTVSLAAPADADVTLKVTAAYVPDDNATTIDDVLGKRYRDALISAALSKLFMIPKKPWSDMSMSEVHRLRWESAADKAKRFAYEGKQNQSRRIQSFFINGR